MQHQKVVCPAGFAFRGCFCGRFVRVGDAIGKSYLKCSRRVRCAWYASLGVDDIVSCPDFPSGLAAQIFLENVPPHALRTSRTNHSRRSIRHNCSSTVVASRTCDSVLSPDDGGRGGSTTLMVSFLLPSRLPRFFCKLFQAVLVSLDNQFLRTPVADTIFEVAKDLGLLFGPITPITPPFDPYNDTLPYTPGAGASSSSSGPASAEKKAGAASPVRRRSLSSFGQGVLESSGASDGPDGEFVDLQVLEQDEVDVFVETTNEEIKDQRRRALAAVAPKGKNNPLTALDYWLEYKEDPTYVLGWWEYVPLSKSRVGDRSNVAGPAPFSFSASLGSGGRGALVIRPDWPLTKMVTDREPELIRVVVG